MLDALRAEAYQLWVIVSAGAPLAGAVTQIEVRRGRMVAVVRYAGGQDLDFWAGPFAREIEHWAQMNGCHAVELDIRPGMAATVAKHGYNEAHRTYRKVIEVADG